MNPKLCKRLGLPGAHAKAHFRTISRGENDDYDKTPVDEAVLLLSIADICNSEISHGGMNNLWREDLTLPKFPYLSDDDEDSIKPKLIDRRQDSLKSFMTAPLAMEELYPGNRIRSVSLDQGFKTNEPTLSPGRAFPEQPIPLVSPVTRSPVASRPRGPRRHGALRVGKVRKECFPEHRPHSPQDLPKSKRSKPLQAVPPKGFAGKKIGRKKFSWKNYPELEDFLIANRDEYLKHSALNYTVQQKSYNNRLTDRLLELATEHGYIFDETDFNFVTVRDRIRCYYKSYVQSAKKRGVLMGYAARKAGLLTEDELVELSMDDGEIVMPSP